MQGKKKGCLISCLVVVALVITLICVVLFVITPNMLGLGDTEILNGQTLNDLGLGDMTVYKIITTIRDLTTPGDEHSILGGDVHTEKDLKFVAELYEMPDWFGYQDPDDKLPYDYDILATYSPLFIDCKKASFGTSTSLTLLENVFLSIKVTPS